MAETVAQKKARLAAIAVANQKSDDAILKELQIGHPQWAQWIIDNPELKKTVLAWAKIPGGPTQEQITAAVYPTKLVQEFNARQQKLSEIKALAPGEYKYQVDQAGQAIDLEAQKQGIALNPINHQKLVDAYLTNGWTGGSAELSRALTPYIDSTTATKGGSIQAEANSLAGIARSYGIPLPKDPTQLNDFLKNVNMTGSEQGFIEYAKGQAKNLYGWMGSALESGVTPQAYLTPAITNIANTLGINANTIDISDPKWSSLFSQPGQNGKDPTASTYAQIDQAIKTDPKYGYDYSPQGRQMGADLADQFKSLSGF
jgi:hypothetical protein